MITMYGFIPAWGLPDVSPFVSKTDLYMRMAKIPFRLVGWPQGDLTKTPVGKLPVIEDEGVWVYDTVLIEEHLKKKYGDRLDAKLSKSERAIGALVARAMDDNFYWYLVQTRYRRDEDFKIYDPVWEEFLAWVPVEDRRGPVEDFRARLLLQFFHSGMGRNTEEEVEQMARLATDAVSDLLGDKPYMLGDEPTSVDAAVYSSLTHCMFTPFPSPIGAYANSKKNLLDYVNRIQKQHYMEFDRARATRGPGRTR